MTTREMLPEESGPTATLRVDSPASRRSLYHVNRRFDLATLFVMTLAYAMLCGVMRAVQFPAGIFGFWAGFFPLVALGQAVLFGGHNPRVASMISGAVYFAGAGWAVLVVEWYRKWSANVPMRLGDDVILLAIPIPQLLGGLLCGYAAGTLIGGVLLIADTIRRRFGRL